jgi:hypothetical protein
VSIGHSHSEARAACHGVAAENNTASGTVQLGSKFPCNRRGRHIFLFDDQ